jgi:spermidine synthase
MSAAVQLPTEVPSARIHQKAGMRWFFAFFFVSGFCSILYEVIWLRLSMAEFGVTTALVSIVLSVFMAGLGLGSWVSGKLTRKFASRFHGSALRLYALTELLIGISAILVPHLLLWGRQLVERFGATSSSAYYLASGVWIALALIPWCACMGATIPVAMWAIGQSFQEQAQRSFSYLYVANVLGAMAGAILPLLVVELYGFRATLRLGAALNLLLAASAMALTFRPAFGNTGALSFANRSTLDFNPASKHKTLLALLFITGLTSMGMEVVWIRQLTPYLGNAVYTFASILALYLASTFVGSRIYRSRGKHFRHETLLWILLGIFAVLPTIAADPQFSFPKLLVTLGIAPFSAALGFVTPMLVDRWSGGHPDKAGIAYAVNVLGCILGPLLSGFLLLPFMGERWVLFVLSIPFLVIALNPGWWLAPTDSKPTAVRTVLPYAVIACSVVLLLISRDYDARFANPVVLRDDTATVMGVTIGADEKRLLVNGVGMTELSSLPKMMAHLPLASLQSPPRNALVICFGMGTTYRSLLSWNIPSTAVELVPSVPRLFGYFHPDGPQLLRSPLSHLVIDDGRRYLERTSERYDVITIDPPPPIHSAGSSLLYTKEFYTTIKQRLQPGGILQQWLPGGDAVVRASVTRALLESFPFVRVFYSMPFLGSTQRGLHFLASSQPIPQRTTAELIARMPQSAIADLTEWTGAGSAESDLNLVVQSEFAPQQMVAAAPTAPAMQDNRPVNEYCLLRKKLGLSLP